MQTVKFRRAALMKAVLLLMFIVAAVVTVRFTGVWELITVEKLGALLEAAGIWAPLAFILIYAVGVCLFIPGTLLTTLGAAIFGPYWGFLYVWVAAMRGAAGAFLIGRYLGREFANSLIGDRLKKYDEAIERNGFATRALPASGIFPLHPMNFGMGLTRCVSGYLWGTGKASGWHLYLYLFRGDYQRSLGQRPVGTIAHVEDLSIIGSLYILSSSQDRIKAESLGKNKDCLTIWTLEHTGLHLAFRSHSRMLIPDTWGNLHIASISLPIIPLILVAVFSFSWLWRQSAPSGGAPGLEPSACR
jgi:uncharacterized membrane protein YdjX (TVP38/TMEM64 family)